MLLNLRWAAGLFVALLFLNIQVSHAQCNNQCPANNLVVNGDFQTLPSVPPVGFTSNFPQSCSCAVYSYCVAAEPRDKCPNSQWINDLWDHTLGNANGRYLIVDGRSTTGQNGTFWQTNVNVVAGNTYTFSYWRMPTVSVGAIASVQMVVNGTNVGAAATGSGSTWVEVCNTWTATTTGNITISLNQTNSGGSGNDFGVDDIFFGTCTDPCEVDARFDVQEEDCVFTFTDFSAPANPSTVIVGWEYKFGDGCSSNEQNPTHVYDSPGAYRVCLTVTALNPETGECCSSEFCQEIEVRCKPSECKIEGDFSFDICDPCVYSFDANVIFANRNITGYYWDFGDGTTGVGENVDHVFPGPGSYDVCLIFVALDRDECCTQRVCQKVEVKCEPQQKNRSDATLEPRDEDSFRLFPNPMNEQTTIAYELPASSDVQLAVRDIQGRLIKMLVNGQQGEGTYQIDLSAGRMPAGTYLVTFVTDYGSEVKRLVIQR